MEISVRYCMVWLYMQILFAILSFSHKWKRNICLLRAYPILYYKFWRIIAFVVSLFYSYPVMLGTKQIVEILSLHAEGTVAVHKQ